MIAARSNVIEPIEDELGALSLHPHPSAPPNPQPRLPLEIVILILETACREAIATSNRRSECKVLDSYPILLAASLVCRDWLGPAMRLLHQQIFIDLEGALLLAKSEAFGQHQTLRMWIDGGHSEDLNPDGCFSIVFEKVVGLQRLQLSGFVFDGVEFGGFPFLLLTSRSLTELKDLRLTVDELDMPDDKGSPNSPLLPFSLRLLKMEDCESLFSNFFTFFIPTRPRILHVGSLYRMGPEWEVNVRKLLEHIGGGIEVLIIHNGDVFYACLSLLSTLSRLKHLDISCDYQDLEIALPTIPSRLSSLTVSKTYNGDLEAIVATVMKMALVACLEELKVLTIVEEGDKLEKMRRGAKMMEVFKAEGVEVQLIKDIRTTDYWWNVKLEGE